MRDCNERRRYFLKLAATGAVGASALGGLVSCATGPGNKASMSGVRRLEGKVTVNGKEAAVGTPVDAGDKIATGPGSNAVVVVGQDAFLLRENTSIETLASAPGVVRTVLLQGGRLLAAFDKKPMTVRTPIATIGLRGTGGYTGAYFETEPDSKEVYLCICYGGAVVEGVGLTAPRGIDTLHHEQPVLIKLGGPIISIEPATFRNHTDEELVMLDGLVGREPPFRKGARPPASKY
jgi:hypothetical protein